jgi:hypothetical protein
MRRRAPRPPKPNNRGGDFSRSSTGLSGEDDDTPGDVEPLRSGWGVYVWNMIG